MQKKTALVVDDEDQLLRLISRVLEKGGFEVHSAMTGADGLALFRAHRERINVTLLDVQLPDMGAAEFLPLMMAEQAASGGPDPSLILTSGADLPEALESQMKALGGIFLRKPFVPKTLLRVLGEVLGTPAKASLSAPMPGKI